MTAPDPRLGLGTTIEFLLSQIRIQVTKIDWDGIKRTTHTKTHLSTPAASETNKVNIEKFPGKLVDGGTIKVSGYYAGDIWTLITSKTERVKITLPLEDGETTPESFEIDAFVDDLKPFNIDPDEKMVSDLNLVVAGGLERIPAA
jgi:hypothetical protein